MPRSKYLAIVMIGESIRAGHGGRVAFWQQPCVGTLPHYDSRWATSVPAHLSNWYGSLSLWSDRFLPARIRRAKRVVQSGTQCSKHALALAGFTDEQTFNDSDKTNGTVSHPRIHRTRSAAMGRTLRIDRTSGRGVCRGRKLARRRPQAVWGTVRKLELRTGLAKDGRRLGADHARKRGRAERRVVRAASPTAPATVGIGASAVVGWSRHRVGHH